jgi:hypothetical protein
MIEAVFHSVSILRILPERLELGWTYFFPVEGMNVSLHEVVVRIRGLILNIKDHLKI